MKMLRTLLALLGLRCEKCDGHTNTVALVDELQWGSNIGGLVLEDPYYARYRRRTCACGHVMSSTFVGIVDASPSDVIG